MQMTSTTFLEWEPMLRPEDAETPEELEAREEHGVILRLRIQFTDTPHYTCRIQRSLRSLVMEKTMLE